MHQGRWHLGSHHQIIRMSQRSQRTTHSCLHNRQYIIHHLSILLLQVPVEPHLHKRSMHQRQWRLSSRHRIIRTNQRSQHTTHSCLHNRQYIIHHLSIHPQALLGLMALLGLQYHQLEEYLQIHLEFQGLLFR